ncbi:MAG: hypothetical protein ACT4NY_05675 [Pseudonocardiales bacterium]
MKMVLLRSMCGEGRKCPNLNATDRGTYLVQGYLVTGLELGGHVLGPGEAVVEIPSSLLPELAVDQMAHGAVRRTGRGDGLGARSPRRGCGGAAGAEGRYVGAEVAPEEMLPRYLAAKDAAWSGAVDFADYWKAHPEYWRDPSVI